MPTAGRQPFFQRPFRRGLQALHVLRYFIPGIYAEKMREVPVAYFCFFIRLLPFQDAAIRADLRLGKAFGDDFRALVSAGQ